VKSSELIFNEIRFRREDFQLKADLRFPAGKLTVVLGPSGSGKTTLLDLAAGFLKPDEGRISEGSTDVTNLSPDKRRVGVVFQDHALFPHLSVRDNVAYGPRSRGIRKKAAYLIADEYLEMTQITRYAHKKPASLSGGEKQRVALARALAIEPEILLLDEPFSSLDAALRRSLRNEVSRIQKETGITAVLVTHDQEEALSLADYLAVMQNGQIVQMGKPTEIWNNPADLFTALFLGRSTRIEINELKPLSAETLLALTPAGSIQVKLKPGEDPPRLPAVLLIRPENLFPSDRGEIRGTVKEIEYTGDSWKVTLAVPGDSKGLIEYNMTGNHPPAAGEPVRLKINPGSPRILTGRLF
jgi:ABC-type Fe3+/spermidine/putrescine transport system ATPase subunit